MYTLGNWPAGSHGALVGLGILREIEPSSLVWMWECVEPDWVEPIWLTDALHDGRVMGFYSCGSEWCGVHVVENDRRRQWGLSIGSIVDAIGRALGGMVTEVVTQRIWLVGTMNRDGNYRELILLRGGGWPDAATVINSATRLLRSPAPAIVALDALPRENVWIGRQVPTLSLAESVSVVDGSLQVDLAPLVAQLNASTSNGSANWLTVTEAAELLMRDLPALNLEAARARVSVGGNRGAFRTNNLKRDQRRIEATSFSAWRLAQRDRDLDAEDED